MENLKKLENLEEIKSIDLQKQIIDDQRPFSEELENKIFQKLKLDWNYNSNAIEGNQLTYGETIAFLNFGLTAKGKPFKDHLDIKGHNEAIQFMLQLIKEKRPFSETDIKDLHKILLVEPYHSKTISPEGLEFLKEIKIGQYKTSPNHVKTISGDIHYYTDPENVSYEMNQLLEWLRNSEEQNLHPVIISAVFHHKFTAIHPFDDGNGRLARILSNFILLKNNFPVIVIKNSAKNQYYAALNIADNGIYDDIVKLFAENISHSFDIIQRAINGENINEPDDLDKEIELFLKETQSDIFVESSLDKNKETLIKDYVIDFFEYLIPKLQKIGELFQRSYLNYSDINYDLNDYKNFLSDVNSDFRAIPFDDFELEIPFFLNDHIKEEFDVNFYLEIVLKNKTIKYNFSKNILDSVSGNFLGLESIYSNIYLYNKSKEIIFQEVSKAIINYIINEIQKQFKN